MIKAIFIDLDGTLLNEMRTVNEMDIGAIKEAEKSGIEVIITTGRSRKDASEIREILGATRYIISSNGSEIYDAEKNKIIYNSPIKKETLIQIYNIAKQNKLKLSINTDSQLYINKLTYSDEKDKLISDNQMKEYIKSKEIVQISLSNNEKDIMKKIKTEISQFKDIKIENQSLGLIDGCEKKSKMYFCDIINQYNNKANSIKILCEYLNIDLNEIAAIGDSPNDILMLELAKDKVAMGNGTNEIKKVANIITDTNTNCGVGKYIKSILK